MLYWNWRDYSLKAILRSIKRDILEAVGNLQLCAGQEAGCKAAIHAEGSDTYKNCVRDFKSLVISHLISASDFPSEINYLRGKTTCTEIYGNFTRKLLLDDSALVSTIFRNGMERNARFHYPYLFYGTAQKQAKTASHLRIIVLDWM